MRLTAPCQQCVSIALRLLNPMTVTAFTFEEKGRGCCLPNESDQTLKKSINETKYSHDAPLILTNLNNATMQIVSLSNALLLSVYYPLRRQKELIQQRGLIV